MIQRKSVLRIAVAALSFSAIGFATLTGDEEFAGEASVPTKNDRPTVCFGMTYRPDGSPVQLGDTCTPVEGIKRSLAHINKDEARLKKCVTGAMTQGEYDVLVDFSYQYGVPKTCASAMVQNINTGNYVAACNAYSLYKFSGNYDCSTMIKGKDGKMYRNNRCWGVWTRNLARRDNCLKAGEGA